MTTSPGPPRLALYGLAGVAGLVGGLAIGMVNYGFGKIKVFVNGIAISQPTWSRTQISAALSVMSVCAGLVSPIMGFFLDKFGVKAIITGCMLLQCLGFFLLSRTAVLELLYVSYALIGVGHAGTSFLGVGKVVGELFPGKNKGRVMGAVTSFNNICGLVFVQIHTFITERYGWEVTAVVVAIIFLVLASMYFVVVSLFYEKTVRALKESTQVEPIPQAERDPETIQENDQVAIEDNCNETEQQTDPPPKAEETLNGPIEHKSNVILKAVLSPVFLFTAIGLMCAEYTYNGVLSQVVPALVAEGFNDETSAHVLSLLAGLGIVAKVFCGFLSERITARRAMELCMLFESVALTIFVTTVPDQPAAWVAFAVYGSSFGGIGALRPLVVLETFGNGFFGRIYGILLLLLLIPALTAPIVAGLSYDQTASYALAFIVASVVFLVGMVFLEIGGVFLRRQKNEALPPYASCLKGFF